MWSRYNLYRCTFVFTKKGELYTMLNIIRDQLVYDNGEVSY